MEVKKFILKGKLKTNLSVFSVKPKGALKGVVQIFHGMGEHKDRYIPFAEYLAENGYAVYTHDHRKHGESVENIDEVGMFNGNDIWDNVLGDCYVVSRHIKLEHPKAPIIVLGHSMGSIILREFLARYENVATAAIIMGTLPKPKLTDIGLPLTIVKIIQMFKKDTRSQFMANLLNKNLLKGYKNPATDFEWLSYNQDNIKKYIEDPLCGYAYTPFFYIEFLKAIKRVNVSDLIFEGKDIPILFVSGKDDPVGKKGVGVNQIRELYSGHGFLQLYIKLFENMKHEILHEDKKQEVFEYIERWLNKNV